MNIENNIFYQIRERNYFDNMVIDVREVYKKFPIDFLKKDRPCLKYNNFQKIYQLPPLPLSCRLYLWNLFRHLNLDLKWFEEFRMYWSSVLGGRPLWSIYDFFFLTNWYRVKFQDNLMPDTDDPSIHLEAWQKPELIFQLFHLVAKESIDRDSLFLLTLLKRYKNFKNLVILEYGCAIAPVIKKIIEFENRASQIDMYIADIQTIAFHYACYRFRNHLNITPILLTPENNFCLKSDKKFDVIFCMAVFEHLSRPLDTIEIFYQVLNNSGILFFDYIKSTGGGLDTKRGALQRNDVIDFINSNFVLLYGTLTKDNSMGLTIVSKK